MVDAYTPDRGDIVWFNFSPHVGQEQAGLRPALVVSPISYNLRSGLMLACPITSKVKGNVDWHERKPEFGFKADAEVVTKTQALIESLVSG
jgi:mRNA-degrading endonuclease toxin of MazEF toxin-antitoxin module